MRVRSLLLGLLFFGGCSSSASFLSDRPAAPPEFKQQKILLDVSDQYEPYQSTRSRYDVGDLQAFHTQHTLPVLVEDAFTQIFEKVERVKEGAKIETPQAGLPPTFEVRIIDVANDIYNEADTYRGELTLAVALKDSEGNILWQKAFRGEGYINVDPQFSTGLGPQDALAEAMRDALSQMQKEIVSSPEVLENLRQYQSREKPPEEKQPKIQNLEKASGSKEAAL